MLMRWRGAAICAIALMLSGCTPISLAIVNVPALIGEFTRYLDVPYQAGARGRADIFTPRLAQHRPVLVFWYGGSWQRGDRQDYRFVGATLAGAGYVVVLADYRLYPQVRFPEFNDDAARAVVWAHQHAAEYGGDPDKLFVMGHSAGAHVAASVALDGRYLARAGGSAAWIRGLIGLSGPYWLEPNTPTLKEIFAAPFSSDDWQLNNFVSGLSPPTLLIHGERDTLVAPANSVELARMLRARHIPVTLSIVAGASHSDTVAALSAPARRRAPTLELVREFIEMRSAQIDASRRETATSSR